MSAPRLRIAPSPTGYFHVGTARTSLFNWLEARRTGGQFLLRIEDTDTERNLQEAIDGIYRSLEWLGLDWDGEPVLQSRNRGRQIDVALALFDQGDAYWSDPMPLAADGKPMQYDGRDRDAGLPRAEGRALRFRSPQGDGAEVVHDLVRGEPTFAHTTIEDFGLLRGNGEPLFMLANVVDDIDMGITHVVRGDDHLTNTAKFQLLWKAIVPDADLPTFAHLPMMVNEQRKKLSKRRDKVALESYRDEGYLPEVMANFLCLCGWSPPDGRERFLVKDVVEEFSLTDVIGSPAFFDQKKLDAFNADAIRELAADTFASRLGPAFAAAGRDVERAADLLPEVQTRIVTLNDAPALVDFLYESPDALWVEADWQKALKVDDAAGVLDAVAEGWGSCEWTAGAVQGVVAAQAERRGVHIKKVQAPVRVAVTGRAVGPPLWESVVVLGRDEAVARVRAARARLEP